MIGDAAFSPLCSSAAAPEGRTCHPRTNDDDDSLLSLARPRHHCLLACLLDPYHCRQSVGLQSAQDLAPKHVLLDQGLVERGWHSRRRCCSCRSRRRCCCCCCCCHRRRHRRLTLRLSVAHSWKRPGSKLFTYRVRLHSIQPLITPSSSSSSLSVYFTPAHPVFSHRRDAGAPPRVFKVLFQSLDAVLLVVLPRRQGDAKANFLRERCGSAMRLRVVDVCVEKTARFERLLRLLGERLRGQHVARLKVSEAVQRSCRRVGEPWLALEDLASQSNPIIASQGSLLC